MSELSPIQKCAVAVSTLVGLLLAGYGAAGSYQTVTHLAARKSVPLPDLVPLGIDKLGKRHAGKLVTVIIEDTHLRVLHDGEELAVRPRRDHEPIIRLYTTGKGAKPN